MIKFIKKVIDYIGHGLWEQRDFKDRKSLWLTKQVRVIAYTVKGVSAHGSIIRSAALTFYTVMSLVPILALAFGIIKAFGLDEQLSAYLLDTFPRYERLVNAVLEFADGVLLRTRGGVVALTGLAFLVWAAVRVFSNVERAFNNIWEIKKKRGIARKVSAYILVIFVIPILWVAVSGAFTYIGNIMGQFEFLPYKLLRTLGSVVVTWIIFTVIYIAIPNTKVLFRHAATAGAIASVSFMAFQWFYIYIQSGVSSYNVIYGSFASIPLFLLWVQTSWQILLFGGELSFSYQNIDSYIQEREAETIRYDNRRTITVAVMLGIIRSFLAEERGITSERLAKELKLPVRLIRDVMYDLENAGLVAAARSAKSEKVNIYLPAKDINSITFYGVLQAVEEVGTHIGDREDSCELKRVAKILDDMERMVSESGLNVPLTHLIKHESSNSGKR